MKRKFATNQAGSGPITMPGLSLVRVVGLRKLFAGIILVALLQFAGEPMHAQNASLTGQGFLRHLTFRGGGGLTSPAGGTGDIMNQGWNVGLGMGFLFNPKIGLLLDWQFSRAGIGTNLLDYDLFPSGSYHIWTVSADPVFNFWHHGRFGSYTVAGGGFSRIQTIYTEPGNGKHCYLLCTCYNDCSSLSGQKNVVYHYSSNQPLADAGLGFTMRISPNRRYSLYTEARYENLFENSNLAPYRNVAIVPLTVGLKW